MSETKELGLNLDMLDADALIRLAHGLEREGWEQNAVTCRRIASAIAAEVREVGELRGRVEKALAALQIVIDNDEPAGARTFLQTLHVKAILRGEADDRDAHGFLLRGEEAQ